MFLMLHPLFLVFLQIDTLNHDSVASNYMKTYMSADVNIEF